MIKKTWKDYIVYQYILEVSWIQMVMVSEIFKGIISKLDYVKKLGVDIIWLSPVYQSPNHDNGYDISDYKAINPDYGTMDDMDLLIKEAEQRGLKIIMDLVINHTSSEHEWFKKSCENDPAYRDYYIWKDKPNNWTSFFGGKAWDKYGDQYYLHLFAKEQVDLNWHNPKVMDEVQNIMKFWLDKGIFGFRCDVINIIFKSSLNNGRKRIVLTGREHYHQQDGMHEILKRLRKEVLNNYETFTVGETVMVTPKQANDLIYPEKNELDMIFGFAHMETDQINNKWFRTKFRPKKFMKVITQWQNEVYWNANYFENHDQQRIVSRFANVAFRKYSAKMFATLLIGLKGTPYIYQGQEIGMTNGDFKDMSEFMDVETHHIYELAKKLGFSKKRRFKMMLKSSRDNNRTPMQWTKDGGFTQGTPWLKQNSNTETINVEAQEKDATSVLNYYKKMIQFRNEYQCLVHGDYHFISMKKNVLIFERTYGSQAFRIICNMNDQDRKFLNQHHGKLLITNYNELSNLKLKPYEARIYLKEI